jgi:hypothetical protein
MKWRRTDAKAGAKDFPAVPEQPSARGLSQPCESVELDITPGNAVRWHRLLAALRVRADERRAVHTRSRQERELPFRDVILKGPHDTELLRARDLETLLLGEFADIGSEFHTLSVYTDNRQDKMRAYFGIGVFAPQDDDRRVADLQFSWSEPHDEANVVTPMLDSGRPAAWYASQMGVAIGFNPVIAPAILDRASATVKFPREIENTYLFIGRRDRLTPPVFEIYNSDRTTHAHAVCNNADWWLQDGRWQHAIISLASAEFTLWFRLTSRTGDTAFRTAGAQRAAAKSSRVVVRGLLLPELPTLARFRHLLSGGATRWSVEFDSHGRLRANEIAELAHSVVAQWGSRFGVYRHRTARWLPRGQAFHALQSFGLSEGSEITHRYFPGRIEDLPEEEAWRALYGRQWSLLQFADERPFGYFDVKPRASLIVSAPEDGTPVRSLDEPDNAEWHVGLDWLNRAANVQVGDEAIGLADYWCRRWLTEIDVGTDYIDVQVTPLDDPAAKVRYQIAQGRRGPLGPLYIEYNPY